MLKATIRNLFARVMGAPAPAPAPVPPTPIADPIATCDNDRRARATVAATVARAVRRELFQSRDGVTIYRRLSTGQIVRVRPLKVRGKAACKAARRARLTARSAVR